MLPLNMQMALPTFRAEAQNRAAEAERQNQIAEAVANEDLAEAATLEAEYGTRR